MDVALPKPAALRATHRLGLLPQRCLWSAWRCPHGPGRRLSARLRWPGLPSPSLRGLCCGAVAASVTPSSLPAAFQPVFVWVWASRAGRSCPMVKRGSQQSHTQKGHREQRTLLSHFLKLPSYTARQHASDRVGYHCGSTIVFDSSSHTTLGALSSSVLSVPTCGGGLVMDVTPPPPPPPSGGYVYVHNLLLHHIPESFYQTIILTYKYNRGDPRRRPASPWMATPSGSSGS